MSDKKIYLDSVLAYREDALANWEYSNPVLEKGEVSIVRDGNDGNWLKIGDGVTAWNDLPYKKGPQGEQGIQGKQGERGSPGKDGQDYILTIDDKEEIAKMAKGNVDQTYNPESENAQSGKAVAEALADFSGGSSGTWETVADITIPEGFSSYNYTITETTYPDMTRITDFYIEISVPRQSEGVIAGALQVQAKANTMTNSYTNIARFETWNHANYDLKGCLFSKFFGDKRHNQYYGLGANATQSLANNSLLGGLNVGYFKELNFALSDTTKTLPSGMKIKIVGCKV